MYFDNIKVGDKVWDLIEEREMIVDKIKYKEFFSIYLRGTNDSSFDLDLCTITGYDGAHKVQRYYWTKPQIIEK